MEAYDINDLGARSTQKIPIQAIDLSQVDILELSDRLRGAIINGAEKRKELLGERRLRAEQRALRDARNNEEYQRKLEQIGRGKAPSTPKVIAEQIRAEIAETLRRGEKVNAKEMGAKYNLSPIAIHNFKRRVVR